MPRKVMKKTVRWYLVAQGAEAVVYRGDDGEFTFLKRFKNPQGRSAEKELDSDRPGRNFSKAGGGVVRHSLDRRHHRHDRLVEGFCRRISKYLDQSLANGDFSKLVVSAEPRLLGILRSVLSDTVKKKVEAELNHEFKRGSDAEIRRQILDAVRA